MTSPEAPTTPQYARKWTYYLQRLYSESGYGIRETALSGALLVGSLWIANNQETDLVKQIMDTALPFYLIGTVAGTCFGTLGMLVGVNRTRIAIKEIVKEERAITAANYRARGFLFNRTVVAA